MNRHKKAVLSQRTKSPKKKTLGMTKYGPAPLCPPPPLYEGGMGHLLVQQPKGECVTDSDLTTSTSVGGVRPALLL